MKKLIIIGVLILSLLCIGLLSGCGTAEPYIFDLCNYNSDYINGQFAHWTGNIPYKLCLWTSPGYGNITYSRHTMAFSPQAFYTNGWGDCNDYFAFIEYVSQQHGFTAYDMYICWWEDGGKISHCNGIYPGVGWSDCWVWHSWTSYSNIVSIYLQSRRDQGHEVTLDYWIVTDNCQNLIASYNIGGKSASDFVIPY